MKQATKVVVWPVLAEEAGIPRMATILELVQQSWV